METVLLPVPGLYPRLLGASWGHVDAAVRRLHGDGEIVRAAGTFRVRRGNRLARVLAWLAGLPAEAEAVDVRLTVTPSEHGEEWRRTFGGRPMASKQWARPDGLLAEQMGLFDIHFRLAVADGALLYETRSAALRLGPWRLPLPGWLRPHVTARETPTGAPDRSGVLVEVRLPWLGLLVAYEGAIARIEAEGC